MCINTADNIYLLNKLQDAGLTYHKSGIDVGFSSYNTEVFTGGMKLIIWGSTHGDQCCNCECLVN